MSRAIAFIRFNKTGNIYYGCYDGTVDIMYSSFTEYQDYFDIFDWCKEHCYDYEKIDKNLINQKENKNCERKYKNEKLCCCACI